MTQIDSSTIGASTATGSTPSRNILNGLLAATKEGVLVVDNFLRVIASNPPAFEAFSNQKIPLENRRLSEIIRDLSLHEAFRNAVTYGKTSDIDLEFIFGEKRSYDIHIAPIELDGEPHAIGVFYDVTQIERLERVRQEFLSNISHELRTPLTSILAFVETLEDGAIDDKANNRRFLSTIRRNAERMHGLIADILELSLIESGNVTVDFKDVRLRELVQDVFTSLSSLASERKIELINNVEAGKRVLADPVRLEQMITNLIDNAIKFNRNTGTVSVTCERRGRRDLIAVTDTGEGILAEHQQRIFERFYRADRGRTREVGGTGLGLAIVKHLAKLHGGEVSVYSKLSEGSTFLVELPA